ncbi:MAG: response regulator [Candidatus Methylomirabilales bacterium]
MATILVVEDNPINMELVCDILESHGHTILRAPEGNEAMRLLRDHHPDLILMDIQLPGLDGLEITRMIKKDPKTKDITVVALTAHAMKGDRERILEAGCSGYIPKPVDTRELPRRVAQYLPGDK